MGIFEDTVTKARELLSETGKATGEVIAVQKLKFEATSLKSAIRKNYELLGQYTYRSVVNEEDNDEAVKALTQEISEQSAKLKSMQEEIASSKGKVICECGGVNNADAKFCSTCGKELK